MTDNDSLVLLAQAIAQMADMQQKTLEVLQQSVDKQDATLKALDDFKDLGLPAEERLKRANDAKKNYDYGRATKQDQDTINEAPLVTVNHNSDKPKVVGYGMAKKIVLHPGPNEVPEPYAKVYENAMADERQSAERRRQLAIPESGEMPNAGKIEAVLKATQVEGR